METWTAEFSGMAERRKTPRKDWVVGRDERGHAVLEWKVDYHETEGGTLTRPPEPTTFCTSSTCPIWRSRKKDGAASAAPETPTTARDV